MEQFLQLFRASLKCAGKGSRSSPSLSEHYLEAAVFTLFRIDFRTPLPTPVVLVFSFAVAVAVAFVFAVAVAVAVAVPVPVPVPVAVAVADVPPFADFADAPFSAASPFALAEIQTTISHVP